MRALKTWAERRERKATVIKLCYTADHDAHEWSKWEIALTPKEERLYQRSVRKKRELLDVAKLDPVLERAEHEIMEALCLERQPRVIFDDPNYPAIAPDAVLDLIRDECQQMKKVTKMLLWYEEHGYENLDEDKERACLKEIFGDDAPDL